MDNNDEPTGSLPPKNGKPSKPKPENADGHRERMRKRFLSGAETIEDYHLLEMLLFYSIPVRDTREQAVALIKHFKSLRGVIEADYDDLCGVEGVGKSSALQLKLIAETMKRFDRSETLKDGAVVRYQTPDELGKLFVSLMRREKDEILYIAAFDSGKRLGAVRKFDQKLSGQVNVDLRVLVEFAIRNSAAYIAIGHNHPAGGLLPSLDDIHFTEQLREYLAAIDITLLEHILCAGDDFYPIMQMKM